LLAGTGLAFAMLMKGFKSLLLHQVLNNVSKLSYADLER